jgi:hypothetical protein
MTFAGVFGLEEEPLAIAQGIDVILHDHVVFVVRDLNVYCGVIAITLLTRARFPLSKRDSKTNVVSFMDCGL